MTIDIAIFPLEEFHRDMYSFSKGHNAPGLYSALHSLGVLPKERFIRLLSELAALGLLQDRKLVKLAVEGYPACGTPKEVLVFHGPDGRSQAERISTTVGGPA